MRTLNVELEFRVYAQAGERADLGESPVADPERDAIWWVDITGQRLFRLNRTTSFVQSWPTPEQAGFVVLCGPDQPAVGMQTGIFTFDMASGSFSLLISFDAPGRRFNDATVDQLGNLWTSSMSMEAAPEAGSVWRVTDDLTLAPVVNGLTIPNGLAVDLEQQRLFCSDSHPEVQRIWTLPLPITDSDAAPASFATTRPLPGRPDGAALDARRFYWIAGVDGGALYVFDPEGHLHAQVPVPFAAPTKVAFVGPGSSTIAVTSKTTGDTGGYLAIAELPVTFASGRPQPYWKAGARSSAVA